MTFNVYDKQTMLPIDVNEFMDEAADHGLNADGLVKFMLTEYGELAIADDCGNYMEIQAEGKYDIDISIKKQGTVVQTKITY